MRITVQSSKAVKPDYGSCGTAPSPGTNNVVPLTVFDKVNFDQYISGINFFRPPAPPNAVLAAGLARALAEYREFAGRLSEHGGDGSRVILLDDAGARFVEATADVAIDAVLPLEPTPAVQSLHPICGDGDGAGELLLVQVTRFACGSVAVGHTTHHAVADGRAVSNFLLAWGQATRGAAFDPVPVHDRESLFSPALDVEPPPPLVKFEHRGVEFKQPGAGGGRENPSRTRTSPSVEEVMVQRVRFGPEFLATLRSTASAAGAHRHSTFQCVVAHLWRCITRARGLDAQEVTRLRIAVDGRRRMRRPPVPDGYDGNVVLWARPATTAGELLSRPLRFAVELVSREVARVDDAYFRSFIDFASSGAVEEERLVPTADSSETALCPDVEVDSVLGIPFYGLDFGAGPPFLYMPGYLPVEGCVIIARSFSGDRSVDAYVPLFSRAMDTFNSCCYSLPLPTADARL